MEPELKIFTIADLRAWLIDNNSPMGLSEHVIAPVRAYAILNNPYVKDDDAVVAAIYDGEELAAFTASFPDMYEGKRIWWATTLWCNPKFQGQGYGLIVVGTLKEAHEPELTLDRWGARETVEIFNCLGYKTTYTSRYTLGDKAINRNTLKGKLAYTLQELKKLLHHKTIPHIPYTLKYSTFVDGEAYTFMQAQRGKDMFFREQKMLNWILQFPFAQGCVLSERVAVDSLFTFNTTDFGYSVVKVYCEGDNLCGVYLLRKQADSLAVIGLYYATGAQELVFASITDHVVKMGKKAFLTEDKMLLNYVQSRVYFPRLVTESISLSVPVEVAVSNECALQFLDGDSFC